MAQQVLQRGLVVREYWAQLRRAQGALLVQVWEMEWALVQVQVQELVRVRVLALEPVVAQVLEQVLEQALVQVQAKVLVEPVAQERVVGAQVVEVLVPVAGPGVAALAAGLQGALVARVQVGVVPVEVALVVVARVVLAEALGPGQGLGRGLAQV